MGRWNSWKNLTQFTGDSYLQSMMGHGLNAKSQSELVDKLVSRGFLQLPEPKWIDVLKTVDRARFITGDIQDVYSNRPIQLSGGHAMSTPQFHAQILSLLSPRLGPGRTAAEIGCGTGYLPACMASLRCTSVYAIETDPKLHADARNNLSSYFSVLVSTDLPQNIQFDAIYISPFLKSFAGLERLISSWQFTDDAVVVAPVQDQPDGLDQQLVLLERGSNKSWTRTDLFRVMCEPLSTS